MKFINDFTSRINHKQKIVVGIIFPLILFVICYTIANDIGGTNVYVTGGSYSGTKTFTTRGGSPFEIEDTWWVWVIFLSIVGYFEYKIWS